MSTPDKSQILLVEGKDDLHVISNLMRSRGVGYRFIIESSDGYESLIKRLPVQIKQAGIKTLGIVVDADLSAAARWQSLSDVLGKHRYVLPATPNPNGSIVCHEDDNRKPLIGIWMMPNNCLPGMIEDFVHFLVPNEDALMDRAKRVIEDIPQYELRFSSSYKTKACLHTWLAWQENPGTPIGQAITKRYLNSATHDVDLFFKWLAQLFSLQCPEPTVGRSIQL